MLKASVQTGLSLMVYSLLTLTDTLFVSWGVGSQAAGAVAASSPIMLLLSALNTIAGTGGGSEISIALGKEDRDRAAQTAANVFVMFWSFALLCTLFGLLFLEPLLTLIGAGGELLPYAKEYSVIMLAGAVTSTGFSSLIRAEGATKYALLIWVIPISVNMALDPVFIFALDMGVTGAALGTLASQVLSVGMSMWLFFARSGRPYKIRKEHFRPDFDILGKVISTGMPAFLQMAGLAVVQAVTGGIVSATDGENAVTALGFAGKIQMFFMLPQYGIIQAAQPLIGYNHASGAKVRVTRTIRYACIWTVVMGAIAALPMYLLRAPLMSLFTSDPIIAGLGEETVMWMSMTLALSGGTMLVYSIYQSIGNGKRASAVILFALIVARLPLLTALGVSSGLNGIRIYYPVSDAIAYAVVMAFMALRPIYGKKEKLK